MNQKVDQLSYCLLCLEVPWSYCYSSISVTTRLLKEIIVTFSIDHLQFYTLCQLFNNSVLANNNCHQFVSTFNYQFSYAKKLGWRKSHFKILFRKLNGCHSSNYNILLGLNSVASSSTSIDLQKLATLATFKVSCILSLTEEYTNATQKKKLENF